MIEVKNVYIAEINVPENMKMLYFCSEFCLCLGILRIRILEQAGFDTAWHLLHLWHGKENLYKSTAKSCISLNTCK